MKQQYTELNNAIHSLLSVCDGAYTQDEKGFNKFDTVFARSLFHQNEWSEKQAIAAHKMLQKYKCQLSGMGIDFSKIPVPKLSESKTESLEWTAVTNGKVIDLSFSIQDRNKFYMTVNQIKSLPGRIFNGTTKIWSVPFSVSNIKRIRQMGFTTDEKINQWFTENENQVKKTFTEINQNELVEKTAIAALFPYQIDGVAFVEKMQGRALIGDEMGLGKTLQAIAWLKIHPEIRPAIVICPATLKINWQREFKKWSGESAYIINGRNNIDRYKTEKLIIINYDIVKDHEDALKAIQPKCIVMDECHKIKNDKAQRTKSVKRLCKDVSCIIGLSGTAILNRPIEIFNTINILQPEIFPSFYRFGQRYCNPQYNGFGTAYTGASNIDELHELLKTHCMIRRKKVDVLKDLPDKRKEMIVFDIDNRETYRQAERDVIDFIYQQSGLEAAERASRAEILVRFNQLKQLTIAGKMTGVISWIEDFLESDEKLVVFGIHKKTIETLMNHFGEIAVKIDGGCSQFQRQNAVDQFQNNPDIQLFVGNIQAASEGITLTAASNVVFVELAWSPGIHVQAEDRVHRIGQKNACMSYYLLAQDTIEEDIAEMIDRKQVVISGVLDGEDVPDESLLSQLMDRMKNR